MSRRKASPLGANYWKLWSASVVSNFGDGLSIVAYPWLASALTRNPIAIAGVAVATRLPWLLFTLPAGVITDRRDRRVLVMSMDVMRLVVTAGVALAVAMSESSLADPADIASGIASVPANGTVGVALLYVAALLLGSAEVLRDNSAQTLMPSIVDQDQLERANGRMWGAEMVMNSFVGPPAAGLLLAISFSLPFILDAATFAVAAGLMFLVAGEFSPKPGSGGRSGVEASPGSFRAELREGFGWLWTNDLMRSMAIALGLLNGIMAVTGAVAVLFAQEVLGLSAGGFGLLGISGAIGGVAGSVSGPAVSQRLGSGPSLLLTVIGSAATLLVIGLWSLVPVVFVMFTIGAFIGTVWNIITVAFRQTVIPDHLLGRVNSVYRFFGWGMIPIGSMVGGLSVVIIESFASREWALRLPFILSAAALMALAAYVGPRLSTEKLEAAKRAAVS